MTRRIRLRHWAIRSQPEPLFSWHWVVTTIVLILLTDWLGRLWFLQYPNLISNETLAMFTDRPTAQYTALVTIDSQDYRTYFAARSPLDPQKLRASVCAILAHHPAVLVVDLDTSDPSFTNLQLPATKTSIVWGRPLYRFRGRTIVGNVLGQAGAPLLQGFAVAEEDRDGAIRSFPRAINIDDKWFPTAYWQAVLQFRAVNRGTSSNEQLVLPRYQNDLEVARLATNFDFPAYALRELFREPSTCQTSAVLEGPPDFSNKVVLLGGTYDYSDTHRTAFQEQWGVEVVASAIESDLSGHGVRHFPKLQKYLVECVLALIIAALFSRLFVVPATLITLAGLLPMVIFGNIIAVWISGYEGMVIPFVVGLLLEQMANAVHKGEHAQRKLQSISSKAPQGSQI